MLQQSATQSSSSAAGTQPSSMNTLKRVATRTHQANLSVSTSTPHRTSPQETNQFAHVSE
jgi:hypothetical protein